MRHSIHARARIVFGLGACRFSRLPLTAACLLVPMMVGAQNPSRWTNLTNGDNVRRIGAHAGRIWAATNGGLVAVNEATGERTFYTRANSTLTSNNLASLHVAPDGHVWLHMAPNQRLYGGGITRFDGSIGPVLPLEFPALPFQPTGLVTDNRGGLWIFGGWAWAPNRLAQRQGEEWTVIDADSAVEGIEVTGVVVDGREDLWVAVRPWQHVGHLIGGGLSRRSGSTWTNYTPDSSGVPSYFVNAVALDRDGAIWVGTRSDNYLDPGHLGGVARFDGSTWARFDSTNSGLASDFVYAIAIDRDGVKWIGTGKGLFRHDGVDWRHFHTGNSGLPGNGIRRLYLDAEDDLWVGTSNAGMARFDRKEWTAFDTSNSPLPYSSSYNQFSFTMLERDPYGNMWIGLRADWLGGGLIRAQGDNWTIYVSPFDAQYRDAHDMAFGHDGKAWAATGFGVAVHDGFQWTIYDASNSPLSNFAHGIVVDPLETVWAGSGRVLGRFDGSTWTAYTSANSGLPEGNIHAMALDDRGHPLLAVGDTQAMLVGFDGQNWSQVPIPSNGSVIDLAVDGSGRIWAAPFNPYVGLLCYDGAEWTTYSTSNSAIPSNYIVSLAAHGSDIWIGTCGGGVAHFDGTNWEAFNVQNSGIGDDYCISAIEVDAAGAVWIADVNGGLSVYRPVTTGIHDGDAEDSTIPAGLTLEAPSVVQTGQMATLRFRIPRIARIDLALFDVRGRKVQSFASGVRAAGDHSIAWSSSARELARGIYWLRLDAQGKRLSRKLVLL